MDGVLCAVVVVIPPERQILGYALQMGTVPACVAVVPAGAWSGPMSLCMEVLTGWQSQGMTWQPTDLWEHVRGDARLSRLVDVYEVLVAPLSAPWDLEGVEAACGVVTTAHREAVWWVALVNGIEEAREQARIWWMVEASAALLPMNAQ